MSADIGERSTINSRISEIVEILSTWGLSADARGAEIERALSEARRPSADRVTLSALAALADQSPDLLSVEVASEARQIVEILAGGGASARARSVRDRIERILQTAGAGISEALTAKTQRIGSEIGNGAPLLGWETLAEMLAIVWRVDRASTLAEKIAALDQLETIDRRIAAARRTTIESIQDRLTAGSRELDDPEARQIGLEALRSGDPAELARASAVLEALHRKADRVRRTEEIAGAKTRLSDLCRRARDLLGEEGSVRDPLTRALLVRAIEDAERASGAEPHPLQQESMEVSDLLASFEKTLSEIVGYLQSAGADHARTRTAIAKRLEHELDRQLSRWQEIEEGGEDGLSREVQAARELLVARAVTGGLEFQQSIEHAADIVEKIEGRVEGRLKRAAEELKASARALATLISGSAEFLPVARLVQARIWIEEVEAIAAEGHLSSIESLNRLIRQESEALEHLAKIAQRWRRNRDELERDQLSQEVRALLDVSSKSQARKLNAIAQAAKQPGSLKIEAIRKRLHPISRSVESAIRLDAGRMVRAAEKCLGKSSRRDATGSGKGNAESLRGALAAVKEAATQDDLPALDKASRELRSEVYKASPLRRPSVRMFAAGGAIAVAAAGVLAWRAVASKPPTYTLSVSGAAQGPVEIWLVRDGRIDQRKEATNGEASFSPPEKGHYEVFVNGHYTGVTFDVPKGPREFEVPFVRD